MRFEVGSFPDESPARITHIKHRTSNIELQIITMDILRIATAGSVDDGKSTLIGRLLFDTKSITTDKLEAVEASSKRKGLDFTDLSLLTDGLIAEREGIDNTELFSRAIEVVDKHYKQLFDFPIEVSEIQERILEVAGTFELMTENTVINKDDFSNYELTLSWLSGSSYRELRYPLWKNPNGVSDNRLPFSFSEIEPIRGFSFKGKVIIHVKDYNDAVVWKNEYEADDSQLKELSIKVRFEHPYIMNAGGDGKDSSRKLRGMVIASDKCPVNDLTIIIQVKEEGDANWRIIGAPKTDKSGNFSTWYSLGDYIAARLLFLQHLIVRPVSILKRPRMDKRF